MRMHIYRPNLDFWLVRHFVQHLTYRLVHFVAVLKVVLGTVQDTFIHENMHVKEQLSREIRHNIAQDLLRLFHEIYLPHIYINHHLLLGIDYGCIHRRSPYYNIF